MPRRRFWGAALPILLGLGIIFVAPRPAALTPEAWRLLGIFAATVAGLIMQPIAGGAVVLIAVTLAPIFGGLTVTQALSGYGACATRSRRRICCWRRQFPRTRRVPAE